MKAPEKIYLQVCGDCKDNDCKNCKFDDLEEITWCKDKIFEKDIEYTCTDAFIEKALAYLQDKFYFNNVFYGIASTDFNAMEEMYEDFIKYMKGETSHDKKRRPRVKNRISDCRPSVRRS